MNMRKVLETLSDDHLRTLAMPVRTPREMMSTAERAEVDAARAILAEREDDDSGGCDCGTHLDGTSY